MLTPRLEMILRYVTGTSVADIGTDHAYIPIELSKKGIKTIATDISRGPLDAASANVKKYNCNVDLRLGGGLYPLEKGETDDIIIAGMGGEMIIKIIQDNPEKACASRLILQPMNYPERLRKFLFESSFDIIEEDLAKEGDKIYNLMVAKASNTCAKYREIDLHLPPCLYEHPLFIHLLRKKEREFTKIQHGLSSNPKKNAVQIKKNAELLSELKKIERSLL